MSSSKFSKGFARHQTVLGFAPILVLIILGMIGVVVYLTLKPQSSSLYPSPTPTQTPDLYREPTGSAATANLSRDFSLRDWKTYTDEKYGFTFNYPQEMEFKPCPDILCGTFTKGASNKEIIKLEGFSYDCWVKSDPSFTNAENAAMCLCQASGPTGDISCDTPTEQNEIAITSGITGYSFVLNELEIKVLENLKLNRTRGPYTVIFFSKPISYKIGLFFEILDKSIIPTFNQILSTFKFLEPQEKEASWEAAVEILKNCEVKIASQTHSLDVYLSLKDGSSIHTKEPRIDLIGEEIIKLREKCGEILYATE